MQIKALLMGVLATATFVVAQEESDSSPTKTKHWKAHHTKAEWEKEHPEAASKYHADMKSLHESIHDNPMFTSMRSALKTAVPESFKEAMHTNPASMHDAFSSGHTPGWYSSLPSDVRSFMEANKKAAQSIRSKDVGTLAGATATETGKHKGAKATSEASHEGGDKKDGGKAKKSEASGLGIIGATVGTLAGAVGVAMLLL